MKEIVNDPYPKHKYIPNYKSLIRYYYAFHLFMIVVAIVYLTFAIMASYHMDKTATRNFLFSWHIFTIVLLTIAFLWVAISWITKKGLLTRINRPPYISPVNRWKRQMNR